MKALDAMAQFLWVRLPRFVGRRAPALGAILADGAYLVRWPPVAVLAPVGAFFVGFLIGGYRPDGEETYVTSILWPLLLFAPSAFGAALGLAVTLGFALGDFFVFPHLFLATGLEHVWTERVPLLITYEVLMGLTVLLPLGVQPLASSVTRLFATRVDGRVRSVGYIVISAAVAGLMAAGWTGSTQILVRPIESFRGGFPSPSLVQPLRTAGVYLIALVIALTILRIVTERLAGRDLSAAASGSAPRPTQLPSTTENHAISLGRLFVSAIVASALLTLLLSGLLDEVWQAVLLFAALLVSAVLREIVLPRAPQYSRRVLRVPVLVRILVLSGVGYAVGLVVLPLMTDNPPFLPNSWTPMVTVASISIVIAAFVMPAAPPSRSSGQPAETST